MARVKTMYVKDKNKPFLTAYGTVLISYFPNFHVSGSIAGMKRLYYGKDALLVKCGSFIYNVSLCPEIYEFAH